MEMTEGKCQENFLHEFLDSVFGSGVDSLCDQSIKNSSKAEFCVQLDTCVTAPLGLHSYCFKREQLNTCTVVPIAVLLVFEMYGF